MSKRRHSSALELTFQDGCTFTISLDEDNACRTVGELKQRTFELTGKLAAHVFGDDEMHLDDSTVLCTLGTSRLLATEVDLDTTIVLADDESVAAVQDLFDGKGASITSLDAGGSALTPGDLLRGALQCRRLRSLSLEAFQQRAFDLTGGDNPVASMVCQLVEGLPLLTCLNLANTKINSISSDMDAIASALASNRSVTELNLNFNPLWRLQGFARLADALQINSTLQTLHLKGCLREAGHSGGNRDFDAALQSLAALLVHSKLTTLDVSENGLCAKGAALVSKAMQRNRRLTALDISRCDIHIQRPKSRGAPGKPTQSGVQAIVAMLQQNSTLKRLTWSGSSAHSAAVSMAADMTTASVAGSTLTASGTMILAAFLPRCREIRQLDMSDSAMTQGSWDAKKDRYSTCTEGAEAVMAAVSLHPCIAQLDISDEHSELDERTARRFRLLPNVEVLE
jgi:hypothetical protein